MSKSIVIPMFKNLQHSMSLVNVTLAVILTGSINFLLQYIQATETIQECYIYLTKLDVLKPEFPRHYLELTTHLLVFRKYPSNMKLFAPKIDKNYQCGQKYHF